MITNKKCTCCHKTKKINSFYVHRDFKEGHFLDNYCKDCAKKSAINLDGLKDYCYKNNRAFSQMLFDNVSKTIKEKYQDDIEVNSLSEEKRESFLFEKTVNLYFSRQSSTQWYEYISSDGSEITKETVIEDDEEEEYISSKKSKEKKYYSQDWQGNYTKAQIEWLDKYYSDTCNDFVVGNRNHKDYVRKIAKSSLAMDEAYNDMMNSVPGADKRYEKAKLIFDTLSQSAKLSEKTRSANDVSGFGSLSEIVAKLEQNGFLQKKVEFKKDDIEKINLDLRHVLSSMDGEL